MGKSFPANEYMSAWRREKVKEFAGVSELLD